MLELSIVKWLLRAKRKLGVLENETLDSDRVTHLVAHLTSVAKT
jgi:hypothetical protein